MKVSDDGKGFVGREEIENFFETFGHPHEEGDATYGRFRMGRGQAMAFGRNLWLSNEFSMDVDLKPQKSKASDGLTYDLRIVKPTKGCTVTIDLYDPLLPSGVDAAENEIKKFCRFAQIPVIVNGKQVNTLPKDRKWTIENEDAYIELKDGKGVLDVYNLGVLVSSFPASRFGSGGIVVSKKPVDVNFARNDIISTCPVFKRISALVRSTTAEKSVKKKKLGGDEWEALADEVRVGKVKLADVLGTPLVRTVTGNMVSFSDLPARLERYNGRLAATEAKAMIGDRLMQRGVALVLDEETFTRFGYANIEDFQKGIVKLAKKEIAERQKTRAPWKETHELERLSDQLTRAKIIPKEDFAKHVSSDYETVDLKDLKPAEKLALDVIATAAYSIGRDIQVMVNSVDDKRNRQYDNYEWYARTHREFGLASCQAMAAMCGKDQIPLPRRVKVGESDLAQAWTDGDRTIWINRTHLELVSKGIPGMAKLASLLLHEYIHQSPSTGDLNIHDEGFYSLHHDLSVNSPIIGKAVKVAMERAVRLLRNEQRKPTGALKNFDDQSAQLENGIFDPNYKSVSDEPMPGEEIETEDAPELQIAAMGR